MDATEKFLLGVLATAALLGLAGCAIEHRHDARVMAHEQEMAKLGYVRCGQGWQRVRP